MFGVVNNETRNRDQAKKIHINLSSVFIAQDKGILCIARLNILYTLTWNIPPQNKIKLTETNLKKIDSPGQNLYFFSISILSKQEKN